MNDFPNGHEIRSDARRDFPEFYRLATKRDADLMDGLVMAHAALVVGMNAPRDAMDGIERRELEQACVLAEQKFSELREAVRSCPTFLRVSDGERFAIEKVAFRVRVPADEE